MPDDHDIILEPELPYDVWWDSLTSVIDGEYDNDVLQHYSAGMDLSLEYYGKLGTPQNASCSVSTTFTGLSPNALQDHWATHEGWILQNYQDYDGSFPAIANSITNAYYDLVPLPTDRTGDEVVVLILHAPTYKCGNSDPSCGVDQTINNIQAYNLPVKVLLLSEDSSGEMFEIAQQFANAGAGQAVEESWVNGCYTDQGAQFSSPGGSAKYWHATSTFGIRDQLFAIFDQIEAGNY